MTTKQQEKADELSQFLADRLQRADYLKSLCLIQEMLAYLKDDVYKYVVNLVLEVKIEERKSKKD